MQLDGGRCFNDAPSRSLVSCGIGGLKRSASMLGSGTDQKIAKLMGAGDEFLSLCACCRKSLLNYSI